MTKTIIILAALIIIGGAAYYFITNSSDPLDEALTTNEITSVEDQPVAEVKESEQAPGVTEADPIEVEGVEENPSEMDAEVPQETYSPGTYQAYSPEKLALAESGDVILFFHATWCPSCKALEGDINANPDNIPENMHILKLDYDTEKELKKKYNVTRQHTLIQVDSAGNEVKRLPYFTLTLDSVLQSLDS